MGSSSIKNMSCTKVSFGEFSTLELSKNPQPTYLHSVSESQHTQTLDLILVHMYNKESMHDGIQIDRKIAK